MISDSAKVILSTSVVRGSGPTNRQSSQQNPEALKPHVAPGSTRRDHEGL